MRRAILVVALWVLHGGALAAGPSDCPDPRAKSIEKDLAQVVGGAVLYSMNSQAFGQAVGCLLSLYIRSDVALAGLKWDLAHALLRVMAADPVQFFDVAGRQDVQALDRWIQSFDHAASWPGDKCPRLDPMTIARSSVENLRLQHVDSEALRKRVVTALKKWPCRVAS